MPQISKMQEPLAQRTCWNSSVLCNSRGVAGVLIFLCHNTEDRIDTEQYSPLNSLSPTGDQHQFSPNNIHTLSRDKVMRIYEMITKEKMLGSFTKFSQLILERKCMEISLENLYVDIGA